MMSSRTGLSDLVHDLRTTLEAISEGLVEGLPDRLLDAEPRLAEIAARLTASPASRPVSTTLTNRDDVLVARAALCRCEQLRATSSEMQQADAVHRAALGALANTSRLSLMDYIK